MTRVQFRFAPVLTFSCARVQVAARKTEIIIVNRNTFMISDFTPGLVVANSSMGLLLRSPVDNFGIRLYRQQLGNSATFKSERQLRILHYVQDDTAVGGKVVPDGHFVRVVADPEVTPLSNSERQLRIPHCVRDDSALG